MGEYGMRNLILAGVILFSQIFCVSVGLRCNALIRRGICRRQARTTDRARARARAIARARSLNNLNSQENALSQLRRNRNQIDFPRNIELGEIASTLNVETGIEFDTESSSDLHLTDNESGQTSAAVNLTEIEATKRVAAEILKHNESGKGAEAVNLSDTDSMQETTAVNLTISESKRASTASYTTTDVGSRRNSLESECEICVKNSPTYTKISAFFKNTAGYKLASNGKPLAFVEDPDKSYLYEGNETFFRTSKM